MSNIAPPWGLDRLPSARKDQGGPLVTRRWAPRILLVVPEVEREQIEQDTRSRLELEIHAGEPIRGHLSASGTGALPFHGWLELAAAIEKLRRRALGPEADVSFP
jgi:hypothetical protein